MKAYKGIATDIGVRGRKPGTLPVDDPKFHDTLVRAYSLERLAWDYFETVADLCAIQKRGSAKALCRELRGYRREHELLRSRCIHDDGMKEETERAELVNEYLEKEMRLLFYGLYNEISRKKLSDADRSLAIAVHQAMTVYEACLVFAWELDLMLEKEGMRIGFYTVLQTEFLKAGKLIPRITGEFYEPALPARKITVNSLVRKVREIEIICKYQEME